MNIWRLSAALALLKAFGRPWDCFVDRFPLTLGCDTAESHVTTFDYDTSGAIILGGWTACTNLLSDSGSQSGIIAKHDGSAFSWYKTINHQEVTEILQIKHILALDKFSVLASSTANPNSLYIYKINNAGTILKQQVLDSATRAAFSSLEVAAFTNHDVLAITSTEIFLAVKVPSSEFGVLKLADFYNTQPVAWYNYIDTAAYSAGSTGYGTSLVASGSDFIYFASVIHDVGRTATFAQLHHFEASGTFHWTVEVSQGAETLTDYYEVTRMLVNGDTLLMVEQFSGAVAKELILTQVNGLAISTPDHTQKPTSFSSYYIGDGSTVLSATEFQLDNSDATVAFLLVQDDTTNSGQSVVLKIELDTWTSYEILIQTSSGINFKVRALVQKTGSSDFYFAGSTREIDNGSESKTSTNTFGFIAPSVANVEASNCIQFTYDWNPTSGGTSLAQPASWPWADMPSSYTWTSDTSLSLQTNSYTSLKDLASEATHQMWCRGSAGITVTAPTDLVSTISYASRGAATQVSSAGFSTSGDTSCDYYSLSYSLQGPGSIGTTSTTDWVDFQNWLRTAAGTHMQDQAPLQTSTMTVQLQAKLSDNSQTTTHSVDFSVTNTCGTIALTAPSAPSNQAYTIADAEATITLPTYTQTDSLCDTPTYTVHLQAIDTDGVTVLSETALPTATSGSMAFFQPASSSPDVHILSSDNAHAGTLRLRVRPVNSYVTAQIAADSSFDLGYSFDVVITPKCSLDTIVKPTAAFTLFEYTIGATAVTDTFAAFSTANPTQCPIEYLLKYGADEITASSLAPIITFTAATLVIQAHYTTNNEFGGNDYTLTLVARYTSDPATLDTQDITFRTTSTCKTIPLTSPAAASIVAQTYTVGTGAISLTLPTYTLTDSFCDAPTYAVNLLTYDASNSIISDVVLGSTAATNSFYHLVNTSPDTTANFDDNSHAATSFGLKITATNSYVTEQKVSDPTFELSYTVAVDVVQDCSLDAITIPATAFATETTSTLSYRIVDEPLIDVFNPFTTVNPTLCELEYQLKVGADDITVSDIAGMVTFTATTRQISIFYDTDNEFSGDTYTLTLEARYVLDTATTQTRDVTLDVTENCEYATLTAPSAGQEQTYTVSQKNSNSNVYKQKTPPKFSTNDSYCDISYYVRYDSASTNLGSWGQNAAFEIPSSSSSTNMIWLKNSQGTTDPRYRIYTADNANERQDGVNGGRIKMIIEAQNAKSVADSTTHTQYFYIKILPDCTQVGVVPPTAWTTDKEYTVYATASTFSVSAFTWANTYCSGTITYTMAATEGGSAIDLSSILTFTDTSRSFSVHTTDNTWGDRTFVITVTGENEHTHSDDFSFTLNTHKDCQYVALDQRDFDVTSSDAALPDYTYTVTESALAITFQEVVQTVNGHETSACDIVYSLYFKEKGTASETAYTIGSPPASAGFITSFDTSTTTKTISIETTDDTFFKNYTLRVEASVDPAQTTGTPASTDLSTWLELNSLCTRVTWSLPANGTVVNYWVAEAQDVYSIARYTTSWSHSGSYSLSTICGAIEYHIFVDTGDMSTLVYNSIDSSIFAFDPTTDASNVLLKSHTTDITKAGSIGTSHTVYPLVVMAQMGSHYKNRAYHTFEVRVWDACWVSQIAQGTPAITDQRVTVLETKDYYPELFTDPIAANTIFDSSQPAGYSCGPYTYSATLLSVDSAARNTAITTSSDVITFELITSPTTQLKFFASALDRTKQGLYLIRLSAVYTNEARYPGLDVDFTFTVGKCIVTNYTYPEISNLTYPIKGGLSYHKVMWNKFTFTPACDYSFEYNSTFENGTALPSWITFEPTEDSIQWYKIDLEDEALMNDTFPIMVNATIWDYYYDPPVMEYEFNFNWYLDFSLFVYIPPNPAPSYNETLADKDLFLDEVLEFTTGEASADTVSSELSIEPSSLQKFSEITHDSNTHEIKFKIIPTQDSEIGTYIVKITLTDEDEEDNPLSTVYQFQVIVKKHVDLSQFDNDKTEDRIDHFFKEVPKMAVTGISMESLLTFQFSLPMVQKDLASLSFDQLKPLISMKISPGDNQDITKIGITSYSVQSFSLMKMTMNVVFENPLYISNGDSADVLQITVNDRTLFVGEKDGISIDGMNTKFRLQLPRMIPKNEGVTSFMNSAKNFESGMKSAVVTNLLINIALQGSLNMLWGMINTLQITLHLPAINAKNPTNAQFVNKILVGITQFEVLPDEILQYFYVWNIFDGTYLEDGFDFDSISTSSIIDDAEDGSTLFGGDDEEDLENPSAQDEGEPDTPSSAGAGGRRFLRGRRLEESEEVQAQSTIELSGYESKSIIKNLGTIIVVQMIFIGVLLFLAVIACLFRKYKNSRQITNLYYKLKYSIFWNVFIRFILELYLELCITTQINLMNPDKVEGGDVQKSVSFWYAAIFGVLVLLLPLYFMWLLLFNHETIMQEENRHIANVRRFNILTPVEKDFHYPFKRQFGSLYDNLKINRYIGLVYNILFLGRRLLFAFFLIQFHQWAILQIQASLMISTFFIIYLAHFKPFQYTFQNRMELYSECVNMIVTYHYVLFTDFLDDVEVKFFMGWSIIGCIIFLILPNMGLIVFDFFSKCYGQRKKYLQKQQYLRDKNQMELLFKEGLKQQLQNQLKATLGQATSELKVSSIGRKLSNSLRMAASKEQKVNRFKAFLGVRKNLKFETEDENPTEENLVAAKAKGRTPFSKINPKNLMEKPQDLSTVQEEDFTNVRSSLEKRTALILEQHQSNLLDPNHPAFQLIQAQKEQAILELAEEESDGDARNSLDTDDIVMTPDPSIELAHNRPGNHQSGGISKSSLNTDDVAMSDGQTNDDIKRITRPLPEISVSDAANSVRVIRPQAPPALTIRSKGSQGSNSRGAGIATMMKQPFSAFQRPLLSRNASCNNVPPPPMSPANIYQTTPTNRLTGTLGRPGGGQIVIYPPPSPMSAGISENLSSSRERSSFRAPDNFPQPLQAFTNAPMTDIMTKGKASNLLGKTKSTEIMAPTTKH